MAKSLTDYAQLGSDLDRSLRLGQAVNVALFVQRLNVKESPLQSRLAFANIARRANAYSTGLRILRPLLLRDGRVVKARDNPKAFAEYAFLLHKIGSTAEAMQILGSVDSNVVPDALLFKTFCLSSRWDYSKVPELLHHYIAHTDVDAYQKLVGMVNLASAYIVLQNYTNARELLANVLENAASKEHRRLLGNTFELGAQLAIRAKDYSRARSLLDQASAHLQDDQTTDSLFVRKWKCLLPAFESNDVSKIAAVRKVAIDLRHWETVRELDHAVAHVTADEKTMLRLYFGTPFPGYRELLKASGLLETVPPKFNFGKGPEFYDLTNGCLDGTRVLKLNNSGHRIVSLFASDHYRPFQIGSIFSSLFPSEHFDPNSSPNRVYQTLFRARAELKKAKLNFVIREDAGYFTLDFGASTSLIYRDFESDSIIANPNLRLLQDAFGKARFSTQQACLVLSVGATTCKTIIAEGKAQGLLEVFKQGSKIEYGFVATSFHTDGKS